MRSFAFLAIAALTSVALPAMAQPAPIIDNERVTVWDVKLAKGETAPAPPGDRDAFVMVLEGGSIRTEAAGAPAQTVARAFGDAVFIPKGAARRDTALTDGVHEVLIALKDTPHTPVANTTGLPAAFPRPGSVKVIDNARATVWHYSWDPAKPTAMHFHDKDVVVAYRYDGTLKSTTPDGTVTVNPYKAGDIRFNQANRSHFEQLVGERQSAMMIELK